MISQCCARRLARPERWEMIESSRDGSPQTGMTTLKVVTGGEGGLMERMAREGAVVFMTGFACENLQVSQ